MQSLEQMALLNSMNQQPQQAQSPLTEGSMAAMQQLKRALAMDDDQKREAQRRSIGAAISRFGAGMGDVNNYSGYGNSGTLGAAALSMNPAMVAYHQGQDLAEQEAQKNNLNALEYMRLMEKEQADRKEKKREHDQMMAQRMAELQETKRYHDMSSGLMGEAKFEKMKEEGLIPKEASFIPAMPSNKQNAVFKQQAKDLETGAEAGKILGMLDEVDELFEKYPNMYKDLNNILYQKADDPHKDLTGWIKDVAINEETKTALDKMNKITSRLVLSEAKSSTGVRSSDQFRRLIAQGKPNFGLTSAAGKFVTSGMRKEYTPDYEHALLQRQAMLHNGFIPKAVPKYEKKEPSKKNESNINQTSSIAQPTAQPVMTRDAARQKLIEGGIRDENVIEAALKAKGL